MSTVTHSATWSTASGPVRIFRDHFSRHLPVSSFRSTPLDALIFRIRTADWSIRVWTSLQNSSVSIMLRILRRPISTYFVQLGSSRVRLNWHRNVMQLMILMQYIPPTQSDVKLESRKNTLLLINLKSPINIYRLRVRGYLFRRLI